LCCDPSSCGVGFLAHDISRFFVSYYGDLDYDGTVTPGLYKSLRSMPMVARGEISMN
jgi:hypothetical protein